MHGQVTGDRTEHTSTNVRLCGDKRTLREEQIALPANTITEDSLHLGAVNILFS